MIGTVALHPDLNPPWPLNIILGAFGASEISCINVAVPSLDKDPDSSNFQGSETGSSWDFDFNGIMIQRGSDSNSGRIKYYHLVTNLSASFITLSL